jgi:hypothetical protein
MKRSLIGFWVRETTPCAAGMLFSDFCLAMAFWGVLFGLDWIGLDWIGLDGEESREMLLQYSKDL